MSTAASVVILSVGDELLEGLVRDTNSHWLVDALTEGGWSVARVEVVGDEVAAIVEALRRGLATASMVVVGGGLGPTSDDRTRDALAALVGETLEFDSEILAHIEERFGRRGRPMPESNRRQALRPPSSVVLPNPVGTAPGLWQQVDGGALVLLPGVPAELRHLWNHEVEPRLRRHLAPRPARHRRFRATGVGESRVAQRVEEELAAAGLRDGESFQLAFYVAGFGVDVVVRSRNDVVFDRVCARVRAALGPELFAEGSTDLPETILSRLRDRQQTLAVAESCTGGMVGAALTDVPGSSDVFRGGVLAYANEVKEEALGVDAETLAAHGAVSEEVAAAMARGARQRMGADWGLSTTGIAGPGGGTDEKPVGTVCLGVAGPDGETTRRVQLGGTRAMIRRWTVARVLDQLRRRLDDGG